MAKTKFAGVSSSFQKSLASNGTSNLLSQCSQQLGTKSEKIVFLPRTDLMESPEEHTIYDITPPDQTNQEEDTSLMALAIDISTRGIQTPLRVIPAENGQYQIVSGHRRFAANAIAVEQLGYQQGKQLPCIVYARPNAGREFEATEDMILDNLQREKSDFERMQEIVVFKRCTELRKKAGEDIPNVRERIMSRLGISNTTITRFEKIHSALTPRLMPAFHHRRIASSVAYSIAKLEPDCQEYLARAWDQDQDPTLSLALMNELVAQYIARQNPSPQPEEQSPAPEPQEEGTKSQRPVSPSSPVSSGRPYRIAPPKSIPEGVTMLDNMFSGIRTALSAQVTMDHRTRARLLKRIAKQAEAMLALQNELALLGLPITAQDLPGEER